MPKITFSGDPRAPGTDPASIEMHGIRFPLGKPVEVPDEVFAKLRTHSHFTAEPDEAPEAPEEPKPDRMAKARAARAAKRAAQ